MAYSERHRWCTAKIAETFNPELNEETAQEFVRQDSIIQQLNIFFKGEGSGRLFITFQPSESHIDVST